MSGKNPLFQRKPKTYTVYGIENIITKKWYIGISSSIKKRKQDHFRSLKQGKHHSSKLQSSFNKHGVDNFAWHILEPCISSRDAERKELAWIDLFDSFNNGYNMVRERWTVSHTSRCKKAVVWNGVPADSIGEMAAILNITPTTLTERLKKGYSSDEDMLLKNRTPCNWNGKDYPSIAEAAKESNYTASIIKMYLKKGFCKDDDVQKYYESIRAKLSTPTTWNGISYPSISEAAKANNIEAAVMSNRIRRGYVCDADVDAVKYTSCTWNGIEYKSIQDAAMANGVDEKTMGRRIRAGRKSDNELDYHTKSCVWDGIEYSSIREAADCLGINYAQLRDRIRKGYKSESELPYVKTRCTWNGIEYSSINKAAKSIGITHAKMKIYVTKGYKCDEDLEKDLRLC